MGRAKESFNKKEVRKKKEKKRKDKAAKKQAKKENNVSSSLDDMIAYVDHNGRISSTPPEQEKEEIKLEDIAISVPKDEELDDEDTDNRGIVSFFNEDKGFGFIRDLKTNQDVFVHVKNTLEKIKEGNLVTYQVEKGLRGPAAVNVSIVKE